MHAEEITANLRPNPQLTVGGRHTNVPEQRNLAAAEGNRSSVLTLVIAMSYSRKKELRLESAKEVRTRIAVCRREDP